MYLICFICLVSYFKGKHYGKYYSIIILINNTFFSKGILPTVLSSNVFTSYNLIRHVRDTQQQDFKTVPSTLASVNLIQMNNKSQIIFYENSTELNENFISKEQYILQKETGILINFYQCYSVLCEVKSDHLQK